MQARQVNLQYNYNLTIILIRNIVHVKVKQPVYQFIGGKKCNPTLKQLDLSKEENYNEFVKSTLTNQLWVTCRSKNETSDKVLVPSWSSLQKQTFKIN